MSPLMSLPCIAVGFILCLLILLVTSHALHNKTDSIVNGLLFWKLKKLKGFCSRCCSQMNRLSTSESCLFTFLQASTSSTNPLVFILVWPESSIIGSDACARFLTHVHSIRRLLISQRAEREIQSPYRVCFSVLCHIQATGLLSTVTVPLYSFLCNSSCGWYCIIDLMRLNFPSVIRHKVPLSFSYTFVSSFCFFPPLIFSLFCFCRDKEFLGNLAVQSTFTFDLNWVTYSKHSQCFMSEWSLNPGFFSLSVCVCLCVCVCVCVRVGV